MKIRVIEEQPFHINIRFGKTSQAPKRYTKKNINEVKKRQFTHTKANQTNHMVLKNNKKIIDHISFINQTNDN